MRIKEEKIDYSTYFYRQMPEKQRRFFTEPQAITYAKGKHYIGYSPRARNCFIEIGFDETGDLYLHPRINTKSGKVAMSENELKELFELILKFLDSAWKNGFLEMDKEEA